MKILELAVDLLFDIDQNVEHPVHAWLTAVSSRHNCV
jgi:hypothetical protein